MRGRNCIPCTQYTEFHYLMRFGHEALLLVSSECFLTVNLKSSILKIFLNVINCAAILCIAGDTTVEMDRHAGKYSEPRVSFPRHTGRHSRTVCPTDLPPVPVVARSTCFRHYSTDLVSLRVVPSLLCLCISWFPQCSV
jgi:hypothetical protein